MIPNFLDDTGPSMDDRSWTGKLRFWLCFFFFWDCLDDDMDRRWHRLQARCGQVNNAFELDAMDDKTNLLAVVFSVSAGCSSSIGFLLGIPKHAYGPRSFSLYVFDVSGLPVFPGIPIQLFGTTFWSIWTCVWKRDKEMVRTYRRARRFHLSSWESPDL